MTNPGSDANQAERKRWNDPFWSEFWPKRERFTESVTPLLLRALELKPGERVLDIGCGGGPATSSAAAAVGNAGRAVGADISTPLIELARSRVIDALFPQRMAGALGDAAMRLAVQDQRVDGAADIVDGAVTHEFDRAGLGIDLHLGDMEAVWE